MASFGQDSQHIGPYVGTFNRCMAVHVQAAREPPDPGGVVVLVAKALTKSDTAGRVILRSGHAEDACCACCSTPALRGAAYLHISLYDVKISMSPEMAAALCQQGHLTCVLPPLQCRSYAPPVRDQEGPATST